MVHIDLHLRIDRTATFPCFNVFAYVNFSLPVNVLFLIPLEGGCIGELHNYEGYTLHKCGSSQYFKTVCTP